MNSDLPASAAAPGHDDPAYTQGGAWLSWWKLPLLIALLIAAADQFTKMLVIRRLPLRADHVVVPDFFHLVHLRNTGAAWGMMRGQTAWLALLSILVFMFVIWKFPALTEGRRERALGLGLVLGGIAGNLIDRLGRGEVVDFLLFYYRSFQWPAFNLADSAICTGVAIFILSTLFREHHEHTCRSTSGRRD